jgi:hypothetical protein
MRDALQRLFAGAAVLGFAALLAGKAAAIPAFAVQTGQPCTGCHVGGFGPQLTPFGREFKLRGYTLRMTKNVPFSAMAVASYLHTQKDQASPPAPHYGVNDNFTLDQVSLFLAGGLGDHLGAFVQATYDGVARAFHWDNLDVRATTTTTIKGTPVLFGASLNNAPTVQDVWNTLPGWGYPYTTSSLGPTPSTAPLIGSLAQNTVGLTGYAWINSSFYLEGGGYQSPGANFLTHAGVDAFSPGNIRGVAPYARLAWQKNFGDKNFELGAFGLWANIYPGRDQSTGLSDRYVDTGLDASFQYYRPNHDVITANARYTHERERLSASVALGAAQNATDSLDDLRADISYYFRNKFGATIEAFDTTGSADPLLYAGNRTFKPDSTGFMAQLDATPWGSGHSPLGPRANMRVGVQYTRYTRFNGAAHNWDTMGANAADNNLVRVFLWVAY